MIFKEKKADYVRISELASLLVWFVVEVFVNSSLFSNFFRFH